MYVEKFIKLYGLKLHVGETIETDEYGRSKRNCKLSSTFLPKKIKFQYTCPGQPEIYDVVLCLGSDLTIGDTELNEFYKEYGFEDIDEAIRCHKACIKYRQQVLNKWGQLVVNEWCCVDEHDEEDEY